MAQTEKSPRVRALGSPKDKTAQLTTSYDNQSQAATKGNSAARFRDAARGYLARGWQPLPVRNGKNPGFKDWEKFTCPPEDVDHHFSDRVNLGLMNGTPSHGLVDVDLDTDKAVAVADAFLPPTALIGGHEKRPGTHKFYQLVDADGNPTPDGKTQQFKYVIAKDETMVVELRGTGSQTIAPPSKHPDGGHYRWEQYGEPGRSPYDALLLAVRKIAIAATLAEFWPNPGRHNTGMAVAGMLYSCGVAEDDARALVEAAARVDGHQRVGDRVRTVTDTYRNAENGNPVKGIPSLKDCFPVVIVNKLTEWCRSIATRPIRNQASTQRTEHEHATDSSPTTPPQEPPRPLRRAMDDPDPYPIDALGTLSAVTRRIRTIIQAPMALCGQSVLAAATLAVQGHADIHIDGRVIPLCEFFLTVAESGERKTAVDREALSSHRDYEKARVTTHQEAYADYENDLAAYKKSREEALKKAKSREARKDALKAIGPAPEEPLSPILTTEEPTYEGLIKLLIHGQPSMGLFADEGGRFVGGYGMSPEQQLKTVAGLSELWDAHRITRVRGGDGAAVLYGRRVSMHLMMQPKVALELLGNPLLIEQGFMSRCLVTWPESTAGTRPYKAMNLRDDEAFKQYSANIARILTEPLPLAEGQRNELKPRTLQLSSEAKALWIQFHDAVEGELAEEKRFAPIRGFANKAPEHALRQAGILTLYNNVKATEVTLGSMAAGITLAKHYLAEALRLFNSARIEPDLILAEKLLTWARQRGKPMTLADLYQRGLNALGDAATARRIAKILEAHGWLVPVQGGKEIDGVYRREVWEVYREPSKNE